MLTITIQEIKFIQKIKGMYPDMSLREIGRQCKPRFGVTRHPNTIKKALNYKINK